MFFILLNVDICINLQFMSEMLQVNINTDTEEWKKTTVAIVPKINDALWSLWFSNSNGGKMDGHRDDTMQLL